MGHIRRGKPIRVVKRLKNQKAAVLISVLIVVGFLSVIGLSLLALVFSRVISVELEMNRIKAFYLAEAGIAASINELKKDVDVSRTGTGNILRTKFHGGYYEAKVNQRLGTITGIGDSADVLREIEIKYKTL